MANVIPMAGLGSRFLKQGYILPKPLIPVSGKPMILRVIECLPESEKNIFIVRKEHILNYRIDRLLKRHAKNAIIVSVEKTTEGQASTCMLAMPYLNPSEEIFVSACDNSFLYNKEKFSQIKNRKDVDAVLWTFTKNDLLVQKPEAWGWAILEKDNETVKGMSVKVPISDNPYNDHAVTAAFYFKKAGDFEKAYNLMLKENYRINNEFYLDSIPIFYKKLNKKTVIFDVDLYIGWGKPKDLYEYQKWEYIIKNNITIDHPDYMLWKRFFGKINV